MGVIPGSSISTSAEAAAPSASLPATKEGSSSGKLQVVTVEKLLELLGGMQGENTTEVEEV